jgi:hypothetical protein
MSTFDAGIGQIRGELNSYVEIRVKMPTVRRLEQARYDKAGESGKQGHRVLVYDMGSLSSIT